MSTGTREDPDAADMERLAAGHDTALEGLMERHGERLFHYLIRLLQNENDAADATQESFVRIYQLRSRFDASQKFSTWLYAIASNIARDRLRWRVRHPQVSLDAQIEESGRRVMDHLPDNVPSPHQTLEATERASAVRDAVAALPDDFRLPLVLAEYEGRPQAEIAEILGCSIKAVEMRIYRARQRLREQLRSFLEA